MAFLRLQTLLIQPLTPDTITSLLFFFLLRFFLDWIQEQAILYIFYSILTLRSNHLFLSLSTILQHRGGKYVIEYSGEFRGIQTNKGMANREGVNQLFCFCLDTGDKYSIDMNLGRTFGNNLKETIEKRREAKRRKHQKEEGERERTILFNHEESSYLV